MLFNEKQSFSPLVLIPLSTLLAGLTYNKIVLNQVTPITIITLSLIWILFIALLSLRLQTSIDINGIRFGFIPIIRNHLSWKDIKKISFKEYNFTDFWGWGLRFNWSEGIKAYTTKGNKGILIELNNGQKILIGTQQTSELKKVLERFGFNC